MTLFRCSLRSRRCLLSKTSSFQSFASSRSYSTADKSSKQTNDCSTDRSSQPVNQQSSNQSVTQPSSQSVNQSVTASNKRFLSEAEIIELKKQSIQRRRERLIKRNPNMAFLKQSGPGITSFPQSLANVVPAMPKDSSIKLYSWPNDLFQPDSSITQSDSQSLVFSSYTTSQRTKPVWITRRQKKIIEKTEKMKEITKKYEQKDLPENLLINIRSEFSPQLEQGDYVNLIRYSSKLGYSKLAIQLYEDARLKDFFLPSQELHGMIKSLAEAATKNSDLFFPREFSYLMDGVFLQEAMNDATKQTNKSSNKQANKLINKQSKKQQNKQLTTQTVQHVELESNQTDDLSVQRPMLNKRLIPQEHFAVLFKSRLICLGDSPDLVESIPFTLLFDQRTNCLKFVRVMFPVLQVAYENQQYQSITTINEFMVSVLSICTPDHNILPCLELVVAANIYRGDFSNASKLLCANKATIDFGQSVWSQTDKDRRSFGGFSAPIASPSLFAQTMYSLVYTKQYALAADLFDVVFSRDDLQHLLVDPSMLRMRLRCLMETFTSDPNAFDDAQRLIDAVIERGGIVDAHCYDMIILRGCKLRNPVAFSYWQKRVELFPFWTVSAIESLDYIIRFRAYQCDQEGLVQILFQYIDNVILPISVESFSSGSIQVQINAKQLELPVRLFLAYDDPDTVICTNYFHSLVLITRYLLGAQRDMLRDKLDPVDPNVWKDVDIDVDVDDGRTEEFEQVLKKAIGQKSIISSIDPVID